MKRMFSFFGEQGRFISRLYLLLMFLLMLIPFPSLAADVTVGTSPIAVVINPVTNKTCVANYNSATVSFIDGATGSISNVPTGANPAAVAVNTFTNRYYVANSADNSVTVIDGASGSVLGTVSVGINPTAIAVNPVTNRIFVANSGDATVTVIDGAFNDDANKSTVMVGTTPKAVAVNPVTNRIYVANYNGASVSVIDGASYSVTPVAISGTPNAIAVNPATNKIYVADSTGSTVTVIDGTSNIPGSPIPVGTTPTAIAINPVSNRIYVANSGSNNVTVIDAANSDTTSSVAVGTTPRSIAINPTANMVYVANYGSNTITAINANTANTTSTLTSGTNPSALAVNPVTNRVYVANTGSGTVSMLDGATYTTATVSAGSFPQAVTVNPLTNKVYVANNGDNTLSVIDGGTGTLTGTVSTGNSPYAVAVNPLTNRIYVANDGSNDVTIINGQDNNFAATVSVGTTPQAIAVNPATGKIYVANYGSNTITVINGSTNSVATTIPAGVKPRGIAINHATNKIYVANYGDGSSASTVTVIDGSSDTVTATLGAGIKPYAVAVNSVTNKIYVVNNGNNYVSVIDGTNNTTKDVTVISGLKGIAINEAGNRIYMVYSNATNNLRILDGSNDGDIGKVTIGTNPYGVAVNPATGKIYSANFGSNDVTMIAEQTSSIPLTVNVTPLPGNTSVSPTPSFPFTASSAFTPNAPPVQKVWYQFDTRQGSWKEASFSTGTGVIYDAVPLPKGSHILYTFAVDGQDAASTGGGGQASPLVGVISAIPFTITGPNPPQVVTGTAEGISRNSATLHASVNDNWATTAVSFEYGLTNAYGSTVAGGSLTAGSGNTSVLAELTGLSCGTTYHFRARAENSEGVATGNDATLTTSSCNYHINTAVSGGNGSITCTSPVAPGSASSCSIAPDPGYYLTALTDNSAHVLASVSANSYTINNVTTDHAITASFGPLLDGALDSPAIGGVPLSFSAGGDAAWFTQSNVSFSGGTAAQSGTISDDQTSQLNTAITTNAVTLISFHWKVSSEENYDFLRFYIDGSKQDQISGEVDWQQRTFALTAGTHQLRWEYSKDGSVSNGTDAGWLDNIALSPAFAVTVDAGTGGKITPAGQIAASGSTATFTITPKSGYATDTVAGCGGTLSGNSYTTAPLAANCTISATFTLLPPQTQTITFNQPPAVASGSTLYLSAYASASSGLQPVFSVTGPASLNGSILTLTGTGTVTVTASQPGNLFYTAASEVSRTITVTAPLPSAPAGVLDPSFNATGTPPGIVRTPGMVPLAAGIQKSDGKIVTAGFYNTSNTLAVERHHGDGTPDTSFTAAPPVFSNITSGGRPTAHSVAVQSDGKIIVAGSYLTGYEDTSLMLVRYNSDGSLDEEFGNEGVVTHEYADAYSIALDAVGRIVVAGESNADYESSMLLLRYNPDGSMDNSFGNGGMLTGNLSSARSVVIQPDGKIVIGGYRQEIDSFQSIATLWRFNGDGTPDNAFNPAGDQPGSFSIPSSNPHVADAISNIALQADGKIVASGFSITSGDSLPTRYLVVWRLTPQGALDPTFSSVAYNSGPAMGSLSIATYNMLRISAPGTSTLALQPDGKIIVGSYRTVVTGNDPPIAKTYALLLRYNADGAPDTAFGTDGAVLYDRGTDWENAVISLLVQNEGGIVVSGTTSRYLEYDYEVESFLMRLFAAYSQTITFTPPATATYGDSPITLHAVGGASGMPVSFAVASGPGTLSGSTLTITGAGTIVITASQPGNAGFTPAADVVKSIQVNKAALAVTLGNLSQTYDGTARTATAATNPTGVAVAVTYDGSATPPVNAGSYTVVATVSDSNYSGTASGTLTIAKGAPIVTWPAPAAITYGTPLSATQLNATAGIAGTFAYSPAAGTILPSGNQTLSVVFTPTDSLNYSSRTAQVTLAVNSPPPLVVNGPVAQISTGSNGAFPTSLEMTGATSRISISAGTRMTDASGNPVTGTLSITASAINSASSLPPTAAAATTVDGKKLTGLGGAIDIVITNGSATVKTITPPMTVNLAVAPAFAAPGTVVQYYSFDGSVWTLEGAATVKPDSTVDLQIGHLSIWGIAKFEGTTTLPSGDINGDGKVDIADALKALQISVGMLSATAAELKAGDVAPLVNGKPVPNGVINVGDAVVILQRAVGLVSW